MSHIVLTGATGLVGSAVLQQALLNPLITRISILARRQSSSKILLLASSSPKITVIIHEDCSLYPPDLLAQLAGAKACIWAQGISGNGISEKDYVRITVEWPIAAARAFVAAGLGGEGRMFNFVYVSGEGADMAEKSMFMWRGIKGRAESKLLELVRSPPSAATLRVFIVRPAIIMPRVGNEFGRERKTTFREKMQVGFAMLVRTVWKKVETPVECVAKVLVELAIGDGEAVEDGVGDEAKGRLIRNSAIRRLAGI